MGDGTQAIGKKEIEAVYARYTSTGEILEAGAYDMKVRTLSIVDHVAFLEWSVRMKSTGETYRGTDTIVVADDEIKSHAVAFFRAPF